MTFPVYPERTIFYTPNYNYEPLRKSSSSEPHFPRQIEVELTKDLRRVAEQLGIKMEEPVEQENIKEKIFMFDPTELDI